MSGPLLRCTVRSALREWINPPSPLDCTIHSGYVTRLVGPDGAGKTSTLIRMLAGLLKADGGNASVLWKASTGWADNRKLHAVLGYAAEIRCSMKILPSGGALISMPIYAALPARYGKRPLPVCLEFTALGLFTVRLAGNCPAG